ncbi:uncharacterized protein [Dysidea avara]|uniref:uncharacterized protein isoform X2 n=1 Tax=Dysidea avara TaxID=196820 RepID=UPI003317EFB0
MKAYHKCYVAVREIPAASDLYSKVVPHHTRHWRTVGIALGLARSVMDNIENDYTHNMERMRRVLDKWLQQDGINATWGKLETAITNVRRAELGLDPFENEIRESNFTMEIVPFIDIDFTSCENVDDAFSRFTAEMFLILCKVKFITLRRACLENVNKIGGAVLPENLVTEIRTAKDLDDLFDVLGSSPYWNWMNIRMLVKMANVSRQPAALKLIDRYREEVYSRKVMEILRQIPNLKIPDKYYTAIKEKWNKNLDEITVQDLVTHWSDVERKFDVQEPTVLLDRVVEGCLVIHWLVPINIIEHVVLSLNDQLYVLPDSLYFDVGGIVIKQDVSTALLWSSRPASSDEDQVQDTPFHQMAGSSPKNSSWPQQLSPIIELLLEDSLQHGGPLITMDLLQPVLKLLLDSLLNQLQQPSLILSLFVPLVQRSLQNVLPTLLQQLRQMLQPILLPLLRPLLLLLLQRLGPLAPLVRPLIQLLLEQLEPPEPPELPDWELLLRELPEPPELPKLLDWKDDSSDTVRDNTAILYTGETEPLELITSSTKKTTTSKNSVVV